MTLGSSEGTEPNRSYRRSDKLAADEAASLRSSLQSPEQKCAAQLQLPGAYLRMRPVISSPRKDSHRHTHTRTKTHDSTEKWAAAGVLKFRHAHRSDVRTGSEVERTKLGMDEEEYRRQEREEQRDEGENE